MKYIQRGGLTVLQLSASRPSLALPAAFRLQKRGMLHHLMVGTWTPPGAIFTFEFDDETLSLKMIKKTEIPQDEPISWMTFDVGIICPNL
jgi:hypothetical protein